ncbi:MAG: hypothetical protein PHX61_00805 [Alphaproteobacteria bacterium]|nr:hypothetical protein [Alphaproteobacteria bacterium]
MRKFQLTKVFGGESEPIGTFDTKPQAANEMEEIIDSNNDDLDEDDEDYLTPFDFTLKEVEVMDVNKEIPDYEAAKRFIGLVPIVKTTISAINPKHQKALIALNTLFTIAEVWNKADNFVPDFSNRNQWKWFPWFRYSDDAAGFVCASTHYTASGANANIGSRLCFKSEERATQFGKQFIDLWNDYLLFR